MEIALERVHVRRESRDVLSIDDLTVASGRRTAVLGPNGAGKTTLLRLIAGLERPGAGTVRVNGERVDARAGRVSYLFQENVFLRRSLLDNVVLGLRARGVSRADAEARALSSLRQLGIESLAGRRADQVSGGEARRASLARALSVRAPVLLLDEPLAGLDGRTYARLLDELPALVAESAATTIVVTHNRDEAFRLCEDVVVLIDGRVRARGTKQEVSRPRDAEVAEVLGYVVLDVAGHRVAIPPGTMTVSAASTPLDANVETVVDMVHEWDITAVVQQSRVHLRVPRHEVPPRAGDRIWLQAATMYELS